MKPVTFLVALTTVAIVLSTISANHASRWRPIKNIHNYRVQVIAEFAVDMLNLKTNFIYPLRLTRLQGEYVPNGSSQETWHTIELKYFTPIYEGLN
ncbi:unnamed protein product [Linum trigynum]|uniref:Uncharacterized protein n=1 Tax=Linum trigynum TaxID=586398 RepID=A0AAV2EJK7_9ROSI